MIIRILLRRLAAGAFLCGICAGRSVAADPSSTDIMTGLLARFTPEKPTLALSYNIAYRFLCLRLKTLGHAVVETTEGSWKRPSGERTHAVMMTVAMDSLDDRESPERGRISLHDRLTVVLTMPQLETLIYLKDTDRHLHPLFRRKSVSRYRQLYDLEGDRIAYYHEDLLTGQTSRQLQGGEDLRRQAQEVPMLLRLMSDIYYGRREQVRPDSNVRLYVNIHGQVTPFSVETDYDTVTAGRLIGAVRTLRARTESAPEAALRARGLVMWSASFQDVAARQGDGALVRLSGEAPDWNMIPLCCDYDLAVGSTRFDLESLRVLHAERWDATVMNSRNQAARTGG